MPDYTHKSLPIDSDLYEENFRYNLIDEFSNSDFREYNAQYSIEEQIENFEADIDNLSRKELEVEEISSYLFKQREEMIALGKECDNIEKNLKQIRASYETLNKQRVEYITIYKLSEQDENVITIMLAMNKIAKKIIVIQKFLHNQQLKFNAMNANRREVKQKYEREKAQVQFERRRLRRIENIINRDLIR
jgi:chromosome segregation ATPase